MCRVYAGTVLITISLQWHQFVTQTGSTMAGPWETEIPNLAASCDYLAHGMMSIAALHLAYLNPDQRDKYEYLSAHHQDLAIGPFRRSMLNVTLDNYVQLFAFAGLLIIAQFAPSRSPEVVFPSIAASLYKGPANWIICHRVCDSVLKQVLPHTKTGPLKDILSLGAQLKQGALKHATFPENEGGKSLKHVSQQLLTLQTIKASTTVDEMEAYVEAIAWLRRLYSASLEVSDSLRSRIFGAIWPTHVSDTFIKMLQEERPPALIITAHYCLLLQRSRACWYMEHRAGALLKAVQQSLAEEWTPYIQAVVDIVQKQD